jgi:hypothetical protein
MRDVSILDAMNDPALLGGVFPAVSGAAWRAFAAALYGLPLDAAGLAIYQQCTGRSNVPTEPAREAWLVCGRRSGKTLATAAIVVHAALFRDWRPYLGPGDVATVVAIACDRRQARTLMRYIVGILERSPVLSREVVAVKAESIELHNRVCIEIHTGNFRSVRGYSIPVAVLDESAFFRDERSALPADELVRALQPALASMPGSLLIGLSSPHSRRGVLWERYRQHYGRDGDVLIWQADSLTMNPTLRAAAIERAYAEDRESASSEWGAQFRSDLVQFLADDLIEAATPDGCVERPPALHLTDGTPIRYFAFVDPSGGRHDAMTLAIAHSEGTQVVLDAVRAAVPPFDPQKVVGEFAQVAARYRLNSVTGDRYAGAWVQTQFAAHGITYTPSELDKSSLYLAALPTFAQHEVTLLDHPRLLTELRLLERRPRMGGKPDLVDHPPRQSDDLANAACGVIALCSRRATWTGEPRIHVVQLDTSSPDGPTYVTPGDARLKEYDDRLAARRGAQPWDVREGDSTWSAYEAERHHF